VGATVGVWSEPDDDSIAAVTTDTVSPDRRPDMHALVHGIDRNHPHYLHRHLPWFGVESSPEHGGLGTQLMSFCLAVVDASHRPAYLESPNPAMSRSTSDTGSSSRERWARAHVRP
jgi:hypothetical protein